MRAPAIKTTKPVVPMIYAYTTPEIERHNGWTKIGYTEQNVEKRLRQQLQTADVAYNLEWQGNAVYDDGSGEYFRDTDFHAYLRKLGIENNSKNEWFHVTGPKSREHFNNFRMNRGRIEAVGTAVPYQLRSEQNDAVKQTLAYFDKSGKKEFLWNAKPRFGKTLSVYDLARRMGAQTVLVVTNRPAVANSWYDDYVKFLGNESGYRFVSETDALKNRPYVMSRKDFLRVACTDENLKCIEFVSLQDLKGSKYFGGTYDKLREIRDTTWDLLVIDEAHEGVDTVKTDIAFDQINRNATLHLSGTPFKALANDKFPQEAIYNWTYADEQRAKRAWDDREKDTPVLERAVNPYAELPRLNLYTYQMSEIVEDQLERGLDVDGDTVSYAFDLNEFFQTNGNGKFVHDAAVDTFLDALTTQKKFPFSTPELRDELRHTFWLLNRVDSARALKNKLEKHPVFKDYEIVLAAGDGRASEDDERENTKAYDKVRRAIAAHDKTITLSVGQLTTGVTIPEWTGVMMLSNMKSPALYMQAAFRAQNPHLFYTNGTYARKENAYVFDFDPARTLTIFDEFANDLSPESTGARATNERRRHNIKELLNFFPVIGEDKDGEMTALDAESVLSIPRRIRSQEVVRRGFMSNFLFQNISSIFGAPQQALDIINKFEPQKEPEPVTLSPNAKEALSIDENGDVSLSDVDIGNAQDLFGKKLYKDVQDAGDSIEQAVHDAQAAYDAGSQDMEIERISEAFKLSVTEPLKARTEAVYGDVLNARERKRLHKKMDADIDRRVEIIIKDTDIDKTVAQDERDRALTAAATEREKQDAHARYAREIKKIEAEQTQRLKDEAQTLIEEKSREIVEAGEQKKRETVKAGIEEKVRDHLRGFSRTIPSFLMAYGNANTTLENFDTIVPDDVFKEVTGITLDEFRFLRDGGAYTDEATGEEKHYPGQLFDEVVFNDSVKEFLRLKDKLSDYFDETNTEDIFDYIPPQKTNQIFTPKKVVKEMVDLLEQENPGCFDDPDKTFADLYMKSGLFIAEIVKRLYNSKGLKSRFPDKLERLRHIFAKQVYGLAPTEIIYRIARNFILGFDTKNRITADNLRKADAMAASQNGTLEALLDEVYPEM